MAFILDPKVVREATTYIPFKNITADTDQAEFDETVVFNGASEFDAGEQIKVTIDGHVNGSSANGNDGVRFKTGIWLNKAICAGTIRAKDADQRDWNGTMTGLRTLANIAKAIGIQTDNPVEALTSPNPPTGSFYAHIRVYRKNNGEYDWQFKRVSKVKI